MGAGPGWSQCLAPVPFHQILLSYYSTLQDSNRLRKCTALSQMHTTKWFPRQNQISRFLCWEADVNPIVCFGTRAGECHKCHFCCGRHSLPTHPFTGFPLPGELENPQQHSHTYSNPRGSRPHSSILCMPLFYRNNYSQVEYFIYEFWFVWLVLYWERNP